MTNESPFKVHIYDLIHMRRNLFFPLNYSRKLRVAHLKSVRGQSRDPGQDPEQIVAFQ